MNQIESNFINSTADFSNITAMGFLMPHIDQANSEYDNYCSLQWTIDSISKKIFNPIRKFETLDTGEEVELGEYTTEDFQIKCTELKERYNKITQE